ncbi:hypothetical protein BS47DRAFT_1481214 [Hydnum rufescens UP504]|uniref:Uncharacterized protein n=1 Tax=Hydnum rufescens UP504 TaxID=1448309 RepID=A0A9P6BAR6_9AGAM|nr:hypothetical protein BS47DRAFT_1481214 [Hydnum rufescens UP504]
MNNTTRESPASRYYNFLLERDLNDASESWRSKEVAFVTPELPTIAGPIERHPLLGTDLFLTLVIQNCHIVPSVIDIDKFKIALSKTLSVFPTFAGRIRNQAGHWWIDLTNSPVPLTIDRSSTSPLPEDWVVTERHLSSFIEPLKVTTGEIVNYDEPLVSVKLSFYPGSNQTVIGYILPHMISDGYNTMRFAQTLSNFYQGIDLPRPVYYTPQPFITTPTAPASDASFVTPTATDRGIGDGFLRLEDAYGIYADDHARSTPVRIRMTASQCLRLKALVKEQMAADNTTLSVKESISRQDAISAFLVMTLNRFLSRPITHVQNLWNWRASADPIHVGGNAVRANVTPPLAPDQQQDMASIAFAIRQTLMLNRSSEVFRVEAPIMQRRLLDHANHGDLIFVPAREGRITINSNLHFDWHAAHFGFPGRVRFHTAWYGDRSVRIFQSNPNIVDGSAIDSRQGLIDVVFRVVSGIRDQVLEAIERDLNALDTQIAVK